MSIKFKAIQKGEPGVIGGGEKKWYASPVLDGEMSLEKMTKSIEKICTVSGADIRAVLYAMVDVSIEELGEGSIVRLGELGSLRPTLKSKGVAQKADVDRSVIKSANVLFTPGTRIKEMLSATKFNKI